METSLEKKQPLVITHEIENRGGNECDLPIAKRLADC